MTIQIELPKGWRIAQDDEPAVRYYGAWVTNAPALPPPAPALPVVEEEANHDAPCPLGCGRRVTTEGDEIHYCITRNADGSKSREYVGTWDGAAMFYGVCYDEVERQVRPYREEQQASELVIAASLLDGGDPDAVEVVEPDEQAATDQGFPWREQDQDELNVMEAACQEVLDSSLTTSLSLDGETTFVTHRSVEKRDEYLKANPDARIAFGGEPAVMVDPEPPRDDDIEDTGEGFRQPITMEDAVNLSYAMRHVPLPNEARRAHRTQPACPCNSPSCPCCDPSHPEAPERGWEEAEAEAITATEFLAQAMPPTPTHPPCPACGPSDHHPQDCPEIAALLMPGPLPDPQNDVCWSCGDQLSAPMHGPALCGACREAGEHWPEIVPALTAHAPALAGGF